MNDLTRSRPSLRNRWYEYLNEPSVENKASLVVALFIASAITLNIIEIVIGSMPRFSLHIKHWYVYTSQILIFIFAFEYFMRMWVAAEGPATTKTNWEKRRAYIFSPMGFVDLFSFLPFLFFLFIPDHQLEDLRILKLVAMARLFKLTRYSASLGLLIRVYQENKRILLAAFLVMIALMFMASAGIYIFERQAQPVDFGSIPAAMWWAFATLTTVGYGDVTPITVGGKVFGSMVTVCGVGVAAMPAGIFASSFVQLMKEQERQERRNRKLAKSQKETQQHSEAMTHLELSGSERLDVDYLMKEFDLTLEQAIGVVVHFRH